MGNTPIYALPAPILTGQADGPAAIQALADRAELMLPNMRASAAWSGDLNIPVDPGQQLTIVSQDVAAVALGWAWIDVSVAIAVGGPQGGAIPGNVIATSGGMLYIQHSSNVLRGLRWHSRNRAEMFYISGGAAVALPLSIPTIQVRLNMATDPSGTTAWAYEYSIGVTQFGAPRGV